MMYLFIYFSAKITVHDVAVFIVYSCSVTYVNHCRIFARKYSLPVLVIRPKTGQQW